ncbi:MULTISPECIES: methyl-accepting chemotaxis protein [Clostridium]|uniref:Methyl-accepting chemotaxis protein McpB n=3 Tax=Clostridium TaxID=1485 RepID=D8GN61_CLOLD|nr:MULTISPECIES: methyl-accepting chemotaxis protein [Clostridium]ADK13685.1 predicted methyl-accepting chemotaxis protein [Clostridium ljungdahlii DSM 13528]AGY76908.1 methyl-accepting chemotaxis protein [Clostridium autoethanogenum DSM 10061]ALU37054.1 Methyl-accepting chemotaxis sensory transducer [Clostridium autoethanogenum DSM 10061]OAA84489.1 Methyl-accepting chemotaxis protein McpB [Clostridium ljungdahlii DSM 13528]OAA92810.1 Methyl-accepting chemotaxis protein McpB [Clostridium coska
MKNLKVRGKINLLIVCIILILSASVLILVHHNLSNITDESYSNQLKSNSGMALKLLDEKYSGAWKEKGGKLYKGSKLISGDTKFVDSIKAETGEEVTIFLKDTRISTTVMNKGNRAVNTKALSEVSNKVLKSGEDFRGETKILNVPYEVIYKPIRDNEGNVLGMFFIGISKSVINNQIFQVFKSIGIIVLLIAILSVIAANIFVSKITKVLLYSAEYMNTLSKGDFTKEVPREYLNYKDEGGVLAKGIEGMRKSVNNLLYTIRNDFKTIVDESNSLVLISKELSGSSSDVSQTINQVAGANTNQAQELVAVNGVIDSFSNELSKIVEDINEIDRSSNEIDSMAKENSEKLPNIERSIAKVNDSFKMFKGDITEFSSNVLKINDITNIINSVSDQTNLLALNAAIEAARAGEAGKGFAVVAEEVRKLASQTKESSTSIDSLIKLLSNKIGAIVKETSEMDNEIVNQTKSINESIEAFTNITYAVNNIIPKIQKVNVSVDNLEKSKDKIVSSVEETSATAEEMAASTEEIAASSAEMSKSANKVYEVAENLESMTENLKGNITKFRINN